MSRVLDPEMERWVAIGRELRERLSPEEYEEVVAAVRDKIAGLALIAKADAALARLV